MTLQERITALVEEANGITAAADADETADGLLTEDQQTRIDAINVEIEKLQAQVASRATADAIAATVAAAVPPRTVEASVTDELSPPAPLIPGAPITTAPAAERDPKFGWNHGGDFFGAIMDVGMWPSQAMDKRLDLSAAGAGLNQAIGSEGGFLVPTEFSTMIWDGMRKQIDNLVELTVQFTVTGEAIEIPAVDETDRTTGNRFGGVQGFFINEADLITRSNPTFRRVKLEPHELAVLIPITNKLMRNSPIALGEFMTKAASDEINFLASNAIINGTGAGQPLGILNSGARVTVAAEGGQAADTVVFENINNMWLRMWAPSRRNAVWVINQDIEAQLAEMSLAVGTGGSTVFLPAGGVADRPFDTLKGRQIMPVEYAATLGDEGDIMLIDFQAYTTGLRRDIEAATSIHVLFETAQSLFRFMWAIDGKPWITQPLTPFNGANTLSPFVTLAART